MNILEIINGELSLHQDWDLVTKARYLYLKSCQYFSYDHRYHYVDSMFRDEIRNLKIDLTNVENFDVICSSWSRQVYLPFLNQIGVDGEIVNGGRGHEFVEFEVDGYSITADACIGSDLARFKMNNNTIGFNIKNLRWDDNFIKEMDKEIAYIKDDYSYCYIMNQLNNLEDNFRKEQSSSNLDYDDNFLIYKFYQIKEMIEQWPLLKYDDCLFAISYLKHKFFNSDDDRKVKSTALYDENWNFANIYTIQTINQQFFFLLTNTDDGHVLYEATSSDVKNFLQSYQKRK